MAEDSSLYSSFPVAHQENCNLVSNVEDAENEQPVSSSSSNLDSNKLPTGRLEFSCCSKKGCQNVFTKTIGRIEDEKRRGNKSGIYFCTECSNSSAELIENSIETEASAGTYLSVLNNNNTFYLSPIISFCRGKEAANVCDFETFYGDDETTERRFFFLWWYSHIFPSFVINTIICWNHF